MNKDYVFKKKAPNSVKGLPVLYLLPGLVPTDGDIGIEIEVEGNKFQKQTVPSPWKYTKDGSLRGDDNAEYVLKKPIRFSEVPNALDTLWGMFDSYGSILSESNRTSVHVHLNVQRFHLNRLCSFFALYFLVEELLTAWCGEHRVGNLFCLRAKDAPAIVSEIKKTLQNEKIYFHDGMHYAGLNAGALTKFGSVEIRSLRGVNDKQIIEDWVSVLERLYNLSAEFPDPRAIPEGFSGNGPLAFLENLLGDKYHLIISNIDYTPNQVMDALYEGVHIAQDLCYCRDWSTYKTVDVKSDPFGRNKKTIAKKLVNTHSLTDPFLVNISEPGLATATGWSAAVEASEAVLNNLPPFSWESPTMGDIPEEGEETLSAEDEDLDALMEEIGVEDDF